MFPDHGGYTDMEKNSTNFWRKIKPRKLHRNMRECSLEVNPEGLGW